MTRTVIEAVAHWSAGLGIGAIPGEVRAVARDCLVDTIGVALAGSRTAVAAMAREVALATAASGEAGLLGSPHRLSPAAAAAVNATAAHALDFDDNCYAGVVHGSAIVIPAALAMAESSGADGEAFLTALIAGSEAEYAIGEGATDALYGRGWWTTGVLGPVGAAVAAAHLLGLDGAATAAALGIAIGGTGGLKAAFGTDAKPLLAGRAAEAGVVAALLARAGASGPRDAVEHPRGFAALFNGGTFDADAVEGLGSRWRLLDPGIDVKRIPVCLSSHAAVDEVVALVERHGIVREAIAAIECDVPPIVVANLVHDRPRSRQEAQFSMPFAIAASLVHADFGLRHLAPETIAEPAVQALMAKVSMRTGPAWSDPALRARAPEGAFIRIALGGGGGVEGFRPHPRGARAEPLGSDAIDGKFRSCVGDMLETRAAEDLLGRLRGIDRLPSLAGLMG